MLKTHIRSFPDMLPLSVRHGLDWSVLAFESPGEGPQGLHALMEGIGEGGWHGAERVSGRIHSPTT